MRLVRIVQFFDTYNPPLCACVRENNLTVPVIQLQDKLKEEDRTTLVIVDSFEVPNTVQDEDSALIEVGIERTTEREEIERNMAILFFWDAQALAKVYPGGVLSGSRPAPLSVGDIEVVLKQLLVHPNYKNQTIVVISEDLKMVTARVGKPVQVESMH